MKKYLILIIMIIASSLFAQDGKSNFILLIVPETDTVVTTVSSYRLSGSTMPGSELTLNGEKIMVYESGAFCGKLNLEEGENFYELSSQNELGIKSVKKFMINRKIFSPVELPEDSLVIDWVKTGRRGELWLDTDDILEVTMRATPGQKAEFYDGLKMNETSEGIYRGSYRVKSSDNREPMSIPVKLIDKNEDFIESQTQNNIAFLPGKFPLTAVTVTDRPALSYGLGMNRLGGAKLGFIEKGIKLKINGRVGNMYRVDLSPNQEAFIDSSSIEFLPEGAALPFSLTSSWSVYGDVKYDYVSIGLREKLPYASFQEINPARIVVDIYGAVSNSNWITQKLSTQEIKNVYYQQTEKEVFRVTIEPKHKQIWGYSIGYSGNNLVIRVKRQLEDLRLLNMTIAIDAGHGGENRGALGSTGLLEKDVNLATAMHLKRELETRGAEVILTRDRDKYSWNSERLRKMIEKDPDLLISIHSNSIGMTTDPADTKGVSTYYKHICYRPLSQFLLSRMMELGLESFGNVGNFNFTLNSETEFPNALVELAFMSNPEDEMLLMDDDFRIEAAKKIADGIEDFLDWCEQ